MTNNLNSFDSLEKLVLRGSKQTVAVAAAQSEEAMLAIEYARQKKIIDAVLVGDLNLINEICRKNDINPENYQVIDVKEPVEAAAIAVELIQEGKAHLLMKGLVETSDFLRAVLNKDKGLKTNNRLCSVVLLEAQNKLIVLADVGTNIAPDVDAKIGIIECCTQVAKAVGVEVPKVAVLCAHEKVQIEAMPATTEAALLSKMSERGQIKGGAIVEGPISMDIAVSVHAAETKNFKGKIQGDANVLIVPDLEAGNILIKGLMYLSNDVRVAGVGMGAKVPLILTSRGDDHDTKYFSIVLSALVSQSEAMQ
ncbi:phosphate butyryltransferase [Sedimentibacter hydroxybenzoicus DSM 7310]|uniref:Phosphate butyryltransferase n=1 Tax=Sedimentibacter hydroxybenzoicus DSM 7310 TaxID=1123245 RepID=A0A974BKS3_SEDHY|nr:phosphate acyltransferase [Sedimentibacter hydroxybenzoicus]NYB74686.1 phosphate butyryltransferase [Sedimentibacter hydroxybenzoicus DSM 7310]